ncbi:hypothetical protein QSJ18_03120 [Gordonia sp. ABSL1-1]|uniref:hypothetical protein n=1 Tax=Gordonia sp. ABSL1-1 TaxID=3053923 RepID=UPI0025726725|nr:hypothetical protein [Gordonia sp. ABSL1-1]MDL9935728.1 hypothetical protein [Gordonia sp. ABSL1-1]
MDDSAIPQLQKMRFQTAANRLVRTLLATPGVSRGIGRRLVTLYFPGARTGRAYTVPVAYVDHDGRLLISTGFAWGKNLRPGVPIEVRLLGTRRPADVEVFTDEATVIAHLTEICRKNPRFAEFGHIRTDEAGNPEPDDLHAMWQAGARTFLVAPR